VIVTAPQLTTIADVGMYYVRVCACSASGCGDYGAPQLLTVSRAPERFFLPTLAGYGMP
jgi:hypothetical protein